MSENIGTAGSDKLRAWGEFQTVLGGPGADTLLGGYYLLGTVLAGGTGSDTYVGTWGLVETLIVLENGNDPDDRWRDDGFLADVGQAMQVDGRHLLLLSGNRSVLFVDWQRPENIIEHWRIKGRGQEQEISFTEFRDTILKSPGYVGDVSSALLGQADAQQFQLEIDQHYAATRERDWLDVGDMDHQMLVNGLKVSPMAMDNSLIGLAWYWEGTEKDEIVQGTSGSDQFNALDGADAIDGGWGRDIIDGGRGSNFLTGGAGFDTFFVDGRGTDGGNGIVVWSTITDFALGDEEEVTIWGWQEGVSRVVATVWSGAAGFEGATWHFDLTGDGLIDASVTLTGIRDYTVSTDIGIISGNGYFMIS